MECSDYFDCFEDSDSSSDLFQEFDKEDSIEGCLESIGQNKEFARELENEQELERYESHENDLRKAASMEYALHGETDRYHELLNRVETDRLTGNNSLPSELHGAHIDQFGTNSNTSYGREISFMGGLGDKNIQHINGSSMVSKAENLRNQANELSGEEHDSEARHLRAEANSLERKGRELMAKAERD